MAFVVLSAPLQVHAIAAGGTNAQQTLPTASGPTAGFFTLTFGGYTTTPLQWNTTAALVQTALGALPSVTTTGVLVTGGPLNTTDIVINFIGPLSNAVTATVVVNGAGLTGTLVPAATTTGAAATSTGLKNHMVGQAPTSMAQATWQVGKLGFTSPTAVTGATAQCFTIFFLQYRAGVLVATLGGYSTVLGNSLAVATPVSVPVLSPAPYTATQSAGQALPLILSGDLILVQTQMVGGTGLAVPIGISAQVELE